MNSKYIILLYLMTVVFSCTTSSKKITNSADYNNYLELAENRTLQNAEDNKKFWTDKLSKSPEQFSYLGKIASSYSQLFSVTADIKNLKIAEEILIKANEKTNYESPGYLMALASNYISQHKFKDAHQLLKKGEAIGDRLNSFQKMLFDVDLELGNYAEAKNYLDKIESMGDFDYLIRLAKWNDHKGNLDAAIKYLEKAKAIAEASNQIVIKKWAYTNLADFYGHAGNIEASYNHYLKALELDPSDAYSKKGIAWIVYSYEKNPDEALRILNSITENYKAPDYYLLKAQIADYKRDSEEKEKQLSQFETAVENPLYGDMYNKYNVLLYTDENIKLDQANTIAKIEVKHRPTPESYDLLAWTYYKKGNLDEALKIVDTHIIDKTYEPSILYHVAEIYKAAGKTDAVKPLKEELLASIYELGPTMETKINNL